MSLNKRIRKLTRPLRYRLARSGIALLRLLSKTLSRKNQFRFGRLLGSIAWTVACSEKERAIQSLQTAFPQETNAWHRKTAKGCFQNLGIAALETLRLPDLSAEELLAMSVNLDEVEPIKEIVRQNQPLIIITGHLANWEYAGATIADCGIRFQTLAKRMKDKGLEDAIAELRASHNVLVLHNDESPRHILKHIRSTGPVSFLVDQDLPDFDGVFVDFFGKPAFTSVAPATLARACGGLMVTMGISREAEGFRWHVGEPFPVDKSNDRKNDIQRATERWSRELENLIRQHPQEWVWMHRRWHTTPEKLAKKHGQQNNNGKDTAA